METFLIRALQLILSISLLVLIHEFGHFMFARLFKIRVEKFYIFFDAWFSLFKYKPKNSDTEYGIGWLPLGGYCKISGMIDESMDTEQMKQPAQDWEFRSKPAWQRLLVMAGGVLMNFLLALFIYSMILFVYGDKYISLQDMSLGMKFNSTAQQIGFRDGDILVSANGKPLTKYGVDMIRNMIEARQVTILRNGKELQIQMPEQNLVNVMQESPLFVERLIPNVIDSVVPRSGFAQAGLQKGDSLIAINGKSIRTWNEFEEEKALLTTQAELDKKTAFTFELVYSRKGLRDTVKITTDNKFMVGTAPQIPDYKVTRLSYSFFSAFPAGAALGWNTMKGYVSDLKYVFSKAGAKSVGGFGTIATLFPTQWDWYRFWSMTAFISIMLAVMNILPIPALDGGHILFLLFEVITRRKPSDKFMEYAQIVGMVLLFALLIYANLNDIIRYLIH